MDYEAMLASRSTRMEASAIREILKVASQPEVVSLAGGLPAEESFPLDLLPGLLDTVVRRYGARSLQYDASEGFSPFREALVPHLAARGVDTSVEQVLVTSGSQSALDSLGKVFLSPGDVVAVEAPTYLGALQAFNPYEPTYVHIDTDDDGLIPESLDHVLATKRVKLIYAVPTFQNPTGRTLTWERRQAVAAILQERDALLIEDDPYADLRYVGERLPPIHALAPDHVIYLTTLSKTFSPGLRLGVCVAPSEVLRWLVIARQGVDLHTGTLGQALASEYLAGGHLDDRLPEIVEFYRPRRDAMLRALERTMPEGVRWTQPEGGMFIWVTGPTGVDARRLYEAALARGVAFVPGRYFYADADGQSLPSEAPSTFRMNFTAAAPPVIERAVEVIAEALHELLEERAAAS